MTEARYSLAIVTHVAANADAPVRRRLPAAIESLEESGYTGSVYIVDDGSTDADHHRWLDEVTDRYVVVRRAHNGGISRAKNTCLRVLRDQNCEMGFIAEDDIAFHPGWHTAYLNAHEATGIEHFSWAWDADPSGQMVKTAFDVKGFQVVGTSRLNGVFLTFTRRVLESVGGFRVMPCAWGHEHTHWTKRIVLAGLAPCFVDIVNSNSFITLNEYATCSTLTANDKRKCADANLAESLEFMSLYWPLEE